jgi:hypothetical protein
VKPAYTSVLTHVRDIAVARHATARPALRGSRGTVRWPSI